MQKISKCDDPVLTIRRYALTAKTLVYIAVANKKLKYRHASSSRIAYIGTTKNGISRIAQSAAYRASTVLGKHGIYKMDFYFVTCKPIQKLKTWKIFEHALILTFRELFGDTPLCNIHGKNAQWRNEKKYFSDKKLRTIIEKYS